MPETEEEFQAISFSSVQAGAIQHLELEKVCGSSKAMLGWSALHFGKQNEIQKFPREFYRNNGLGAL